MCLVNVTISIVIIFCNTYLRIEILTKQIPVVEYCFMMTFFLSRMEAIPVKSLIVTQGPSSSVPNSVSMLWQMMSEQQVVSEYSDSDPGSLLLSSQLCVPALANGV
jgi:hypothetical protein